jgi:hypothetical protein
VVFLNNKTGQWIVSRIMIVILIYHRHKPTHLISNISCLQSHFFPHGLCLVRRLRMGARVRIHGMMLSRTTDFFFYLFNDLDHGSVQNMLRSLIMYYCYNLCRMCFVCEQTTLPHTNVELRLMLTSKADVTYCTVCSIKRTFNGW